MRLPLSLLLALIPYVYAHSFENTAVVRSIELGGSLTTVKTVYSIKSLTSGADAYTVALGLDEEKKTSSLEARIGNDNVVVQKTGFSPTRQAFLYSLILPKPLPVNGTASVSLTTIQSHASYPWPAQAAQSDPQTLKYEADLFVLSPYPTLSQRTKVRSPTAQVHSYKTTASEDALRRYSTESPITRSGATITFGPFENLPQSATFDFQKKEQSRFSIHYDYDKPVLTITKLERSAEISHWGNNLNIQDSIWLRNDGPILKGQYSRLEHGKHVVMRQLPAQTVTTMSLKLPAGVHSPYYYDLNGNVSTSHFRAAASLSKDLNPLLRLNDSAAKKVRGRLVEHSHLEFKARYPILGGWNYSFILGYDSPLSDWAVTGPSDDNGSEFIVGIPFFTEFPYAAVDDAKIQVVLPEGAIDVHAYPPFEVDSTEWSTVVTYLDTTGRPSVSFTKRGLTEKHTGIIYVTYSLPLRAHLQKPVAVSTVALGLFVVAMVARRVDPRIHK